nr:hypothetical protein [uncultured Carboxylicivirga sp.]
MKNIKYSIFDLFSYTIPGGILILVTLLSNGFFQTENENMILIYKKEYVILAYVILIISSYIIGFLTSILGSYFLKLISIFVPKIVPKNSSLNTSTKLVLLREFSPINFNYIEKWYSMKSMCSNLAIVLIFSSTFLLIKTTLINNTLIIVAIATSIVILYIKAFQFDKWSIIELDNAIHILKLENNSEELLKSKLQS